MSPRDDIPKAVFDVRQLNVTKLDRVVDCDIAIEEADQSLRNIERQLADPFYNQDPAWLVDVNAARCDIEHKRRVLKMKRDALASARETQQEIDARNIAGKATLRDQLAGQALLAYLLRPDADDHQYVELAEWSYDAADAMLAYRSNGGAPS